jgi:hypothetical protein
MIWFPSRAGFRIWPGRHVYAIYTCEKVAKQIVLDSGVYTYQTRYAQKELYHGYDPVFAYGGFDIQGPHAQYMVGVA